jgi:HK97 gp10 family phage protein
MAMELEGLDSLLKRVEDMGRAGTRVSNTALKNGAEQVSKAMSDLVQVSNIDEKHIKDDIKVSNIKTKDGAKYVEVGPGKETNWRSKFIEFGTSKMTAKPFMGPAYESKKGEVKEIIKQELRNALNLK